MDHSRIFHYSVLRFVKDSTQGISLPFGIFYWEESPTTVKFRLPESGEDVSGLPSDHPALSELFISKLTDFLHTGKIPYGTDIKPYSEVWWEHLCKLFIHRFVIEMPRRIEVSDPDIDFDLQFAALVKPTVTVEREETRIDSLLNRAMGKLSARFSSHGTVPGYKGRPVRVLKLVDLNSHYVAVDAVNLTIQDANLQLEAMLHRARELSEYQEGKPVKVILGYAASPEGLNGEAKLVELGSKIIKKPLLNLSANADALRGAIERELVSSGLFTD